MNVFLPPQTATTLTVEGYLVFEREAEERHEYFDGILQVKVSESPTHSDIIANLVYELGRQSRNKSWRVRFHGTKIFSGSLQLTQMHRSKKGLFSYPDVVVIYGEPQYLDTHRDVVLNPQVIIEILSESTEAKDRGAKFIRYRHHLSSLTDYILVSQHAPLVEHFICQTDGDWLSRTIHGLSSSLTITSLDCTIALAEIYRLVNFPPEEIEEDDPTENAS